MRISRSIWLRGRLAGAFGAFSVLGVLGLFGLMGCAAAPAGPRGPLLGPGVEVATDLSYAFGHGEATLPSGSRVAGGADTFWSPVTVLPRRLEGRLSPIHWLDVGGEIGWLGGGIEVRVGRRAIEGRSLALNLAGGLETGEVGPFKDTKPTNSQWIRLEAYPAWALPADDARTRLVLALGFNFGRFYHELSYPRSAATVADGLSAPSALQLIRRETRLETSIGLFRQRGRFGSVLFTVNPYFVLKAGDPSVPCDGCDPLAAYRERWGIVVVFRVALRHGF